jgi:hypothetical protein
MSLITVNQLMNPNLIAIFKHGKQGGGVIFFSVNSYSPLWTGEDDDQ